MLTHKGTQKIQTDRLILREFDISDAKDMLKNWANDVEVCKFLTWKPHGELSVTEKKIDDWVNKYENPNAYNWAILYKETGEVIGGIQVIDLNEEDLSCEVGYCMSRLLWGKGIMTEALKAVISYMINEIGINRVEAQHNPQNIASGKVMQKAGMKFEGIKRQATIDKNGEFYDLAMYSILESDVLGE